MSIFGGIMDKIFHRQKPAAQAQTQAPAASATPARPAEQPAFSQPGQAAAQPAQASSAQASPPVDVEAVLVQMAELQGGGGNWRSSIVDLLKMLNLDSSLEARKQLADELGVHEGDPGSAEQNIALHRAVMRKLEENGGVVPDSLKH